MEDRGTPAIISAWFDLRQNLLKFTIGFAVICLWLSGCQSPVWESLKKPYPQREDQLLEESLIQKAFANAGLRVQTPNWQEKSPRYRCQTQYFEVSFAAAAAWHRFSKCEIGDAMLME